MEPQAMARGDIPQVRHRWGCAFEHNAKPPRVEAVNAVDSTYTRSRSAMSRKSGANGIS